MGRQLAFAVMVVPGRFAYPQRLKHLAGDIGHSLNGSLEGGLICLRRCPKTADLANELQGSVVQLGITRRVIRMAQTLDVAAHGSSI
jgi:hypothetical protein